MTFSVFVRMLIYGSVVSNIFWNRRRGMFYLADRESDLDLICLMYSYKYMGSYKLTKIIITIVYSLILSYTLLKLSTMTTVNMESKCANPTQSQPFCAQCFTVPADIHSKSYISINSPVESALSINNCKSFTCSEMLQLFDPKSRKVSLRESVTLNVLTNLLMIEQSKPMNRYHLQKNRHLIFYTSQDVETLTLHSKIQFASQGITSVINILCGMTLLFLMYIMVCQKQFSMPCSNILSIMILLTMIIVEYNWPTKIVLMNAITHAVFIFFVMDCAKIDSGFSVMGSLIGVMIEYFKMQQSNQFLSILLTIIILVMTIFGVRNQFGTNQRFAILVMLLYSVLMIGWTVQPNAAPFQLLLLFLMNWSASMLYVFSIQNVGFKEYQVGEEEKDMEEADEVQEQEEDLQESENKLEAA